MTPRRVLVAADGAGGVWDYSLELAAGLSRHGTGTILAVIDRCSPSQRAAAAEVPGVVVEEGGFALEWMADGGRQAGACGRWLLALERRHVPDIVHLNAYAPAALPWLAPRMLVAHSCVRSWWRTVRAADPPSEWDGYCAQVAASLSSADLLIAPSRSFHALLESIYGRLPNCLVIRNGRSPDEFAVREKRPFVFSVGRLWDEGKNIAALDRAAATGLPLPVMVAGDWRAPHGGGHPPRHLHCLGQLPQNQVRDWLARAAIFALPARYEPFGLAVLEAALSRCALVLGDIPTYRELWRGAAIFVPPDDHMELAAVLRALAADPAQVDALGNAARVRGLDYSSAAMVEGYRAAYADLLARQRCTA